VEVKDLKRENLSLHESVEAKDDKIRQLQLEVSNLQEDISLKAASAENEKNKAKEYDRVIQTV
jgi:hypothetical protein